MTQRTTVEKVRIILPAYTGLTDSQIQAAIDAATCIVDEAADSCSASQSDACLLQIETYLSAHFAAVTENTLTISNEQTVCGGTVTYGFKFGEGIKGTPYGQMANTLSGGCIGEFDKSPVSFHVIGTVGGYA